MSVINGRKLHDDICNQGYTNKELSVKSAVFHPKGEVVSTKCIERASSPKHDEHHVSDLNLSILCKVIGTTSERYSIDEQVEIFTQKTSRERFRAAEALIAAIDENRIPKKCWEFFLPDGTCFKQHVLDNPLEFSTNTRISREHWLGAFVDLRHRDIVVRLQDNTYRIVGAKRDEMLEIIEERTEMEIRAAQRACKLNPLQRELILCEMNQAIDNCNELLQRELVPKALIEVEGQFHLAWAGSRSAQRRLLMYTLEVCKQLGDRLMWINEDGNITCRKPSFATEFRGMVDELEEMKNAFDTEKPDAKEIEKLIRKHTLRSVRLIQDHNVWYNRPWAHDC